jgi:hypothetical protein
MMYEIAKQLHEELLVECRERQRLKSLMKKYRKRIGRMGNIVPAFVDYLIKTGVCLKKRWAEEEGKA